MPRGRCGALLLVLSAMLLQPAPASAWGFAAHRFIMRRAVDLLPADIRPFFVRQRDELVMRVIDPDLWRLVGWEDDPHHFVNFGMPELGPYPFAALPRDYGAAVEKFGAATLKRVGLLPWREAEQFGNLRRAFEGFRRGPTYGATDTVLFAAVASHYLQDAHQPLHATVNYDGLATGQRGVHARFERDLFERFEARLNVVPAAPRAFASARDTAFDTLLASYQLVDPLLKADRDASGGRDVYDDAYFEAFFARVKPMLEERLGASITATASLILSAWEQAGRPALVTGDARPVDRIQRAPAAPQAR